MVELGYMASIFMGISLGLIGGGGSILTVPILFYFFGLDSLTATTYSLFVVGSTALVGVLLNARSKNVDFKTGLGFAIPSFIGVFMARQWVLPTLPDTLFSFPGLTLSKPLLLMLAFAIIMILASRAMIRGVSTLSAEPNSGRVSYLSIAIKGFFVGGVTGFVGAGGGFLIIPALVLLLRFPMRLAIGTSLAIISANSLFGFMVSEVAETTNWTLLLTVTALGGIGIFVGQSLSNRIQEHQLRRGFGYFVLLVGSAILLDQISRMF